MEKNSRTAKTSKKRTRVGELKRKERALIPAEAKKVKGGIIAVLIGAKEKISDGTSN